MSPQATNENLWMHRFRYLAMGCCEDARYWYCVSCHQSTISINQLHLISIIINIYLDKSDTSQYLPPSHKHQQHVTSSKFDDVQNLQKNPWSLVSYKPTLTKGAHLDLDPNCSWATNTRWELPLVAVHPPPCHPRTDSTQQQTLASCKAESPICTSDYTKAKVGIQRVMLTFNG